MSREMQILGLNANVVEFPAVPRDKSLFRFQMMATMTEELIVKAAERLHKSVQISQNILLNSQIDAVQFFEE
jgi:7-keto-8-aminopelargonate synthetase-like enzyme